MRTVAVDTGGTFTDVVLDTGRGLTLYKLLSTPRDPSRAVVAGLGEVLGDTAADDVIHGSTVATNALLERRGARTAFITTAGFEDLLIIGRQTRPELYNLFTERPPPLVPRALVYGLPERVRVDGSVQRALGKDALRDLRQWLERKRPQSVAVCLLHAYANAEHEAAVGRLLATLKIPASLSSRVHPEFREVERGSTTVVNAYVMPKMGVYLGALAEALPQSRLSIMQSNGGRLGATRAQAEPVHTILSGPAGGVVGAFTVAERAGFDKVVTFDMGGTSTDVALCDGAIPTAAGTTVGGLPVAVPMIDIHTVGAGGGSIASLDVGGALRVGPESAGADPGPICYGQGTRVTVTDAHVFLGRVDATRFLGGRMRLTPDRIAPHLGPLARRAGLTAERFAEGVLAVANANMERAIRVISVERGYDPRQFALVAFGGAGGLHACDLARALEFRTVIVPPQPGLLSAFGMLWADSVKDFAQTVLVPYESFSATAQRNAFAPLERAARNAMKAEGFAPRAVSLERLFDLRYVGQAYELSVPSGPRAAAAFHALHHQQYGHADATRPVEVVTLRVRVRGRVRTPRVTRQRSGKSSVRSARIGTQRMRFGGKSHAGVVYDREGLRPGHRFIGPAIVTEMSATTVVPPDFRGRVDGYGNLLLEARRR